MLDKAFFMNLLKENNGIVQSKLLAEAGIDGKILQRLEQSGEIERIGRGL
ncbi:MAG: type IV toxin-antitoxin system AbiEi family antitoxin domain-containing protein, partial [Firmicutes bacterium]|nr:type IV toxin-antitoxin system AbiEi family antitoxin domain-containing protein [Bacillota bacterium]